MIERMRRIAAALLLGCWALDGGVAWGLDVDRLSGADRRSLHELLERLAPVVERHRVRGTLPLMTYQHLYVPLTFPQRTFLDALRAVPPESLGGASRRLPTASPYESFVRIDGQIVHHAGEPKTLHAEYLPRPVFDACRRMMAAMRKDVGRRLLVESGYRSPAHQLYLFCFYLPKHDYSIRETNRYVALPECSEHGSPVRQAVDFINEDGINGEDHPEEFEALPEYAWLKAHASEHGFYLSYPRDNTVNTAFEPWHWHYEAPDATATGG